MYYKLQQLFVWILNPIYEKVTYRIPDATRNIIIGVCFAMMFLFQICRRSGITSWAGMNPNEMALLGCVFMGIVIVISVDRELTLITNYNKFLELLLLCGTIILLVSFIHPVGSGFRALALTMIVGFPCLYCVWENRRDYNVVFEFMAKGIAILGGIYFVCCMISAPVSMSEYYMNWRYLGTTNNPNFLGMICTTVICAVLYLIINKDKCAILYILIGGIATMYLWLSESRTSILSAAAAVFCFIVYYVKTTNMNVENGKKKYADLITILVVFMLAIIIGSGINKHVYNQYTIGFGTPDIKQLYLTA